MEYTRWARLLLADMREPSPLPYLSAALALLLAGCGFDPVVRPIRPRQLNAEHALLLGTLDVRGEYLLLAREQEKAAPALDILHWRTGRSCQLPVGSAPLGRALVRAPAQRGPALFLPLTRPRSESETELLLVDELCTVHDGLGLIAARSPRVHAGSDGHLFLTYRDPQDTLFLLDPYANLAPFAVARTPAGVRVGKDGKRDALWLIEAGRLTQRSLQGQRLHVLGSVVSSMVLDSDAQRIAFIDGGALFEAVAPNFVAREISPDACSPRYANDTLEFFAPCDPRALVRIHISRREVETFETGVYASSVQDGVQLDYAEAGDNELLFAQFQDGQRLAVTPTLGAGDTWVLDDERLIGVDPQQRFGVWNRQSQRFAPLFSRVESVIPHHRGKTHNYSWLIYHDVQPDGLGSLSLLDEDGMLSAPIAHGVPRAEAGGYSVINGNDLPHYPFSAPLVIALEEAAPLPSVEPRWSGRLRALSMRGDPSVVLAEGVSSYALVASPVPAVLFTVDDGPERGLWYAAL